MAEKGFLQFKNNVAEVAEAFLTGEKYFFFATKGGSGDAKLITHLTGPTDRNFVPFQKIINTLVL